MIARAAESNPSCFLPTGPLSTCEDLIPKYVFARSRDNTPMRELITSTFSSPLASTFLPAVVYLRNHYSNTKFLLYQFKPSPPPISKLSKPEKQVFSAGVAAAKTEDDALAVWGLNLTDARKKGRTWMRELEFQLRARDPTAYGEGFVTEDPEEKIIDCGNAVAKEEAEAEGKDVFEQHAEAVKSGKVVDPPENEEVLKQEELDDEEAMMNAM